ncbi:hypothetical protein T492DRAFT_1107983, partial [Pavlovales sp. CCMP2436]
MWCALALASLLLLFGSMLDGSRTEGAAPVLHPGRRVLSAQPEPIHRPTKHPSQCWEVVARAATKDAVLESRDRRRSPSRTSRCSWQRGDSSRRGKVRAAPSTALGGLSSPPTRSSRSARRCRRRTTSGRSSGSSSERTTARIAQNMGASRSPERR